MKNGQTHWSLICSCMDWIEVAIDFIVNQELDNDNVNIRCMQAYACISAIDIVWQSIQQLHRAVIDQKSVPFAGDRDIFVKNNICQDDNEYFKHIRAVFGAHPVNLNREGKWFASWPTDNVYHEYDYAVILYNANEDQKVIFGYCFSELEKFLVVRYQYLSNILMEIERQIQEYKSNKSLQKIVRSDDMVEQLNILKNELEHRLDNDYYSYLIEELLILYRANNTRDINRKVIEEYLNECRKLVMEIYSNLQNMEPLEPEHGDLLNLRHPTTIHYDLSKIYECLRGTSEDRLYNHYIKKIGEFLNGYISISSDMHAFELYLLIKAGLYSYWKSNCDV